LCFFETAGAVERIGLPLKSYREIKQIYYTLNQSYDNKNHDKKSPFKSSFLTVIKLTINKTNDHLIGSTLDV